MSFWPKCAPKHIILCKFHKCAITGKNTHHRNRRTFWPKSFLSDRLCMILRLLFCKWYCPLWFILFLRRVLAPCCLPGEERLQRAIVCQNQNYLRLLLCLRLCFFCNLDCFLLTRLFCAGYRIHVVSLERRECSELLFANIGTVWCYPVSASPYTSFSIILFQSSSDLKEIFAILWDPVGIESHCGV